MNTRRWQRCIESEMLSLFEERRPGNKRHDRQMVNLVELQRRVSGKTSTSRRKQTPRRRRKT